MKKYVFTLGDTQKNTERLHSEAHMNQTK